MKTVKIISPIIANIDGKSKKFEVGDIVECREYDADNLVRGKYAEYVHNAKPAVKVVNAPKPLSNKSMKADKK